VILPPSCLFHRAACFVEVKASLSSDLGEWFCMARAASCPLPSVTYHVIIWGQPLSFPWQAEGSRTNNARRLLHVRIVHSWQLSQKYRNERC